MELRPGGSAHPAVRSPAGPGPEDRHAAGAGRTVQRRRRGHFVPQEPRSGENALRGRVAALAFVYVYSDKTNPSFVARSGRRSGKATWTAPWRRAPVESDTTRAVSRDVGSCFHVFWFISSTQTFLGESD